MAYFTTLLQRQVDDVWRRKIAQADAEMRLHTSGKEIRDFLNDRTKLNTVGFVIRRHISDAMPALMKKTSMETGIALEALTTSVNVPWPEEFTDFISGELNKIAKSAGVTISKITWSTYLSDGPGKMYKDSPYKVAFALNMDAQTTEGLLMACGKDTYCLRNPEQFIYFYCQNRPVPYDWKHAQDLIKIFNSGGNTPYNANHASEGMTQVLKNNLSGLFSNQDPDDVADAKLIKYMNENRKEFSGLSLTNRSHFLRMAEYLSILYPTYSKTVSDSFGAAKERTIDVPVSYTDEGKPALAELVRALFSTGGWLNTTIGKWQTDGENQKSRTASSIKRREENSNIEYRRAPINEDSDKPFLNSVQYFVDSYAHHLDAIDRVFRRPANPGNVERRDVILFTYFFIRRYPELLADEDHYVHELDRLTSLAYGDMMIDSAMDRVMDELYTLVYTDEADVTIIPGINDTDPDDKCNSNSAQKYLHIFNMVLGCFGMKRMYMPNPWDRFIYMSLFAEDPDFFTEAVLWNTIGDDDEIPEELSSDEGSDPDASNESDKENNNSSTSGSGHKSAAGAGRKSAAGAPTGPLAVRLTITSPNELPIYTDPSNGSRTYTSAKLLRRKNGELATINKRSYIFGRHSNGGSYQDYGFRTANMGISRRHAAIIYADNNFYLVDISSYQETFLNGNRLKGDSLPADPSSAFTVTKAYPLKDMDEIRIGDEIFTFTR